MPRPDFPGSEDRTTLNPWALLGVIYGMLVAQKGNDIDEAERVITRFNQHFWKACREMYASEKKVFVEKALNDMVDEAIRNSVTQTQET